VPYCVSKGGLDQLTKVMALSLAPYGIRVNAIRARLDHEPTSSSPLATDKEGSAACSRARRLGAS